MKQKLFLLIIVIGLANSCEKNPQVFHDYQLEGKWILTSIEDLSKDGFEYSPRDSTEINFQFRDENKIFGSGPCNTFGGDFEVRNDFSIEIENLHWTEMACLPMEIMNFEERYFLGLMNAESYSIVEDKMTISTSSNYLLNFIKD